MEHLIEKIRQSSESAKQMVILGLTLVLGALFFAGWVWYVDGITTIPENVAVSDAPPPGVSFRQSLFSGFADMGRAASGFIRAGAHRIATPKDIEVAPNQ